MRILGFYFYTVYKDNGSIPFSTVVLQHPSSMNNVKYSHGQAWIIVCVHSGIDDWR